jgi:hypothetical protein
VQQGQCTVLIKHRRWLFFYLIVLQALLTALAVWTTWLSISLVQETGEPVRALQGIWVWAIWLGAGFAGIRAWKRAR